MTLVSAPFAAISYEYGTLSDFSNPGQNCVQALLNGFLDFQSLNSP